MRAVVFPPEAGYRVLLLRKPLSAASDAPGVVRLYDRAGRSLAQADVEMVQLVEDVEWSNDRASIKLVVWWNGVCRVGRRRGRRRADT